MEAIKQDYTKASTIYSVNCQEYNFGHSCHKAASYKFAGRGCKRDLEASMKLYERACELDYAPACLNAGLLEQLEAKTDIGNLQGQENKMVLVKANPPDHRKAMEFFKKGCLGGVGEACHRYSSVCLVGLKDIIQPNFEEAFAFALKGCDLGVVNSCVNVSVMYKKGDGVEANEKMARRYANIATDMMRQETEDRERIKFQEGVETVGGKDVKQ